jgi:hypothetical protein
LAVTLVAGAAEDGKAGIFGKMRVGFTQFAEQELRAFAGSDYFCVPAVRAQAKLADRFVVCRHAQIIRAQDAGVTLEL